MDAQLTGSGRTRERQGRRERRAQSVELPAKADPAANVGEDDIPALLDTLCVRLAAQPARLGRSRLLCLDGPAGAGKSTLAGQLATWLDAPVVHMEDLYDGWGGLEDSWARLAEWVLQPWTQGRDGAIRPYDWHRRVLGDWQPVPIHRYLIVEGCGSGRREADQVASLILWLHVDQQTGLARAVARDGEHTRSALQRWQETERVHFEANDTANRADLRLRMT